MSRVTWSGLEELKLSLRNLPDELVGEATHIVEAAANGAEADIKAGYNRVSGELAAELMQRTVESGRYGIGIQILNTAPHAWWYDNGTQARHYRTKRGRVHQTGRMWGRTGGEPPTHLFVGTIARARRRMYEQFKDLLTRHGLAVSGEA